jgi:hypothetical protein
MIDPQLAGDPESVRDHQPTAEYTHRDHAAICLRPVRDSNPCTGKANRRSMHTERTGLTGTAITMSARCPLVRHETARQYPAKHGMKTGSITA